MSVNKSDKCSPTSIATSEREKYNTSLGPALVVDYSILLILLKQPCKIKAGLWESDYVSAPLISSPLTENAPKISQKETYGCSYVPKQHTNVFTIH